MASDPRPHTARRTDGLEDTDLELRFDAIFRAIRAVDTNGTQNLPRLEQSLAALQSEVQALRTQVTARIDALDTSQAAQDARLSDIETRLTNAGIP